jgi:cytochrome b subunit of formate dehydrogenase
MFNLSDLFQWERFITPAIIQVFYWLVVILSVLFGLSGIAAGLRTLFISPIGGLILVVTSLASSLVGVLAARILAEFVLIVFRISEHLSAIRNRNGA